MSTIELKSEPIITRDDRRPAPSPPPPNPTPTKRRRRMVPILVTLGAVVCAAVLTWAMWDTYMAAPWTRDGTVRVYVVTKAPEVAGRVVELPVVDNQFVQRGDLLMVVDPTDFVIAVHQAEAAVDQAKATARLAQAQADRRQKLTDLAISLEQKQVFSSGALSANAAYRGAVANLDQARANLERTRIISPVNGYVTNLLVQLGDFVAVGQKSVSVVNVDSFWVDAYFQETSLRHIREGDRATIKLMGHSEILRGHVEGIARGINVPNAQPDSSGLASVNPIFTWVRLAQRVPVRMHIDHVPSDVRLVAGLTATVAVDDRPQ